jgi:outer membrane protein assembly factor BamE (lipoprotein component of BamABCDE complex)
MKAYRLTLLATALLALAAIPVYHTSGEDNITIDSIQFGTLVINEDISKEDLQDHVVGVKYMGKW